MHNICHRKYALHWIFIWIIRFLDVFLFTAKQYPRKFADQRDSGYFIGFWDEGPPKNQLYYSSEVILMSIFLAFDIANIFPGCHAL